MFKKYSLWHLSPPIVNATKYIDNLSDDKILKRLSTLDPKVLLKIQHTIFHSRKVFTTAIDRIPLNTEVDIEHIAFHDLDKILMYFYNNNLDKSLHNDTAAHHFTSVLELLNPSTPPSTFTALIEGLADCEATPLSKVDNNQENAYHFIKKNYSDSQPLLDKVNNLGFLPTSPPPITKQQYLAGIAQIDNPIILKELRAAARYVNFTMEINKR